ncbi:MAG TPA: L,D-transpeptidase family protein [Blastocatellia bacterium]|nr:L,D-transpeptidase family protein [Blastocatellia bacterium]
MSRASSWLTVIALLAVAQPDVLAQSFKARQMVYPRVRAASETKDARLRRLFRNKNLDYPANRLFIRAFKRERIVEVWVASSDHDRFELLKDYAFCASSGVLGPKRREGDGQIPEGFYYIDRFNPTSRFHLSLGINYPNQADRILGARNRLGGDIFIHGNCVTIGCIPITDDGIEELYLLAVEARSSGQLRIPVHVFPTRLDNRNWDGLKREYSGNAGLISFWADLKKAYDFFAERRRAPTVSVSSDGRYVTGK